jgi:hypothetical protein
LSGVFLLIVMNLTLGFVIGFWVAWPWARAVGFRAAMDPDALHEKWMDDATSDKS